MKIRQCYTNQNVQIYIKMGENSLNLQSCLLNEREEGIRVVKQSKDCSFKWTLACKITF